MNDARLSPEAFLLGHLRENESQEPYKSDPTWPEGHVRGFMNAPFNRRIDATNLKHDMILEEVTFLCDAAYLHDFNSVVIPPHMVRRAFKYREDMRTLRLKFPRDNLPYEARFLIKTVVSFPNGWDSIDAKTIAIQTALEQGADICDVVVNPADKFTRTGTVIELSKILSRLEWSNKIGVVTPIIEVAHFDRDSDPYFHELVTGLASIPEILTIKTATGVNGKTRPVDVEFIANLAFQESQGRVIVKAAGGISSFAIAQEMLQAGAAVLGTSHYHTIIEEWQTYEREHNERDNQDVSGKHE